MAWTDQDAIMLNSALRQEKMLTAKWYQRISGEVSWLPGERERIDRESDRLAKEINDLIAKKSSEEFGELEWA